MLAKELLVREEEPLITTEEQISFSQEKEEVEIDLAKKAKEILGYTPLILEQERKIRKNKEAKDRFLSGQLYLWLVYNLQVEISSGL